MVLFGILNQGSYGIPDVDDEHDDDGDDDGDDGDGDGDGVSDADNPRGRSLQAPYMTSIGLLQGSERSPVVLPYESYLIRVGCQQASQTLPMGFLWMPTHLKSHSTRFQ